MIVSKTNVILYTSVLYNDVYTVLSDLLTLFVRKFTWESTSCNWYLASEAITMVIYLINQRLQLSLFTVHNLTYLPTDTLVVLWCFVLVVLWLLFAYLLIFCSLHPNWPHNVLLNRRAPGLVLIYGVMWNWIYVRLLLFRPRYCVCVLLVVSLSVLSSASQCVSFSAIIYHLQFEVVN